MNINFCSSRFGSEHIHLHTLIFLFLFFFYWSSTLVENSAKLNGWILHSGKYSNAAVCVCVCARTIWRFIMSSQSQSVDHHHRTYENYFLISRSHARRTRIGWCTRMRQHDDDKLCQKWMLSTSVCGHCPFQQLIQNSSTERKHSGTYPKFYIHSTCELCTWDVSHNLYTVPAPTYLFIYLFLSFGFFFAFSRAYRAIPIHSKCGESLFAFGFSFLSYLARFFGVWLSYLIELSHECAVCIVVWVRDEYSSVDYGLTHGALSFATHTKPNAN